MSFNVNIKISQEVFDAMKRLPRERYDVLKTLLIDRVSLLRNFPKIGSLTQNVNFRKFIIEISRKDKYIFYYNYDEVTGELFIAFFQHSQELQKIQEKYVP